MADQTQAQVQGVQDIMANVQAAYDSLARSRTTLAKLIGGGAATCQDVKVYNLQARAVWAYQASVAGIIKQQGGQPPAIPAPYYVGWRGVAGDRFAEVDCSSAQFAGPNGGAALAAPVNPQSVEWRQEVIPADAAFVNGLINQASTAAVNAAGQAGLGFVPIAAVIPIILVGIVVVVALIVILKIAEVFMDIPGKREVTKQIASQAAAHDAVMTKRESCYTSCVNTGKDQTACARDCTRLYTEFKPSIVQSLGIVGKVAGVAALGLIAYVGYRFVKGGGIDRIRDHLPGSGGGGGHGDTGDGIDVGGGMTVLPARHAA